MIYKAGKTLKKLGEWFIGKKYPYQTSTGLLIAYILGIFLAKNLNVAWRSSFIIFVFVFLLLLAVNLINLLLQNKQLVMLGWFLVFLLVGVAVYSHAQDKFFCISDLSGKQVLRGTITNNPVRDYKDQEVIITLDEPICSETRVLTKLPLALELAYGHKIEFTAELQKPSMIEDFDYAKYLRPQKISYLAQNPGMVTIVGNPASWTERLLKNLYLFKNNFESAINRSLVEPEASLAVGLITGSKSNLSQELKDNLNTSGLTHIVALSGFNVTIIVAALASVLAGIFSRRKIFWIGSGLVVVFIIMTGASASVVRAGIFSLLMLFGKTFGRRAYQTNILLLAAAIMLFFNPFLLADDLGFQLSFLAFAGIIYLGDFVAYALASSKLSGLPDWLKKALTETLSAQILVFPLIAFAFGRVSLISPVTNVVVLWILPLAMLLAFLVGIFGLISLYLGKIFALLAWPVLAYIINVANLGAKIPFAALNLSKYQLGATILLYLIVGIATFVTKRRVAIWQKSLLRSS